MRVGRAGSGKVDVDVLFVTRTDEAKDNGSVSIASMALHLPLVHALLSGIEPGCSKNRVVALLFCLGDSVVMIT